MEGTDQCKAVRSAYGWRAEGSNVGEANGTKVSTVALQLVLLLWETMGTLASRVLLEEVLV